MKQIGHTKTGDVIVEMTEGEYSAVKMLAYAVDGRNVNGWFGGAVDTIDMEPAFRAVTAWVHAKALSGDLRALADAFAEGLDAPQEATK